MKMQVAQAIAASKVFGKAEYAKQKTSMRLSLWFARNGKITGEIAQNFVDVSQQVFDSMAVPTGENNDMIVPEEKMQDYRQQIAELLDEEVEVEVYKISVEDFGDFEIAPVDTFSILYAIEV